MKRSVVRVLVFTLLFCFSFVSLVLAESGTDYSNLSLDELISMRSALDTEIENRMVDLSTKLIPGTYVVGRDLKAGSYIVLGLMDEGPSGYTPQALISESAENAEYSEYIDYQYMKTDVEWHVTVVDGNVIEVRSKLYPVKRTRERVTFEPTFPEYGR